MADTQQQHHSTDSIEEQDTNRNKGDKKQKSRRPASEET
jgi:hypothetical protein